MLTVAMSMPAVHGAQWPQYVHEVGVLRRVGEHARVVFLLVGGALVGHRVVDVRRLVEAGHDAGRGRAGERIVDALHGRHRHAEGRSLGVEQAAAGVALHDGDADVLALAERIQLGARGVHALEGIVVVEREGGLEARRCRQQVEGGVHAEHDHLDLAGEGGALAHFGAVGGQSDVLDGARGFERAHVVDERAGHDALVLVDVVHVVDHAELHVVGAEAREQVFEGGAYEAHVARAHVLPVLPGGADVPLNDPAIARVGEGGAQVAAHVGAGHPAIEDVDALLLAARGHGAHLGGRLLLHPLGAEADLAHHEPGLSQSAVFHEVLLLA